MTLELLSHRLVLLCRTPNHQEYLIGIRNHRRYLAGCENEIRWLRAVEDEAFLRALGYSKPFRPGLRCLMSAFRFASRTWR